MSYKADITIIGAGVIGLAIASQVTGEDREIHLLEKMGCLGKNKALATTRLFILVFTMKGFNGGC